MLCVVFEVPPNIIGSQRKKLIVQKPNVALNTSALDLIVASTVLLEIVLCMMALIISLAIIFLSDSIKYGVQIIISIFEYYLVFVMVLNMLILIKRFKALIDNG